MRKVGAIHSYPVPTTKKRVHAFLGLVGWYRKLIPNFADRAAILTDHTKASAHNRVKWTDDCDQAFEDLKRAITSESVLHNPDFSQPFTLQTDTSGDGPGAVPSSGHTWRETSCPVSEPQAPGPGDQVFDRGEGVFSREVGCGVAEILLAGSSLHP